VAANGISGLPTKEQRQIAKLNLASLDRTASGNPRSNYVLSQLPTRYVGNETVVNTHLSGLILGRPWVAVLADVFIRLSATAGSFYKLGSDWIANGDFKISFNHTISAGANAVALVGNENGGGTFIRINDLSTIKVQFDDGGSANLNLSSPLKTSKLSLIEFQYVGNTISVSQNGQRLGSASLYNTSPFRVRFFGQRTTANYYSGILSNAKLTDLTNTDNDLEFKLNKLTDNFELPVGSTIGSELTINGDFADGTTGWLSGRNAVLSVDSGKLRVTNTDLTSSYAYQDFTVAIGTAYKIELIGYTGSDNTDVRIGVGPGSQAYYRDFSSTSPKIVTIFITPTHSTLSISMYVGGGSDGDFAEYDNVSVKEVSNIGISYENIALHARSNYELVDGVYYGPERIVGGDFSTPSDWLTSGESTVSNGRAHIFSTSGSNTYVYQQEVFIENESFRIVYDIFSYASGVLRMSAVSALGVSTDLGINTIDFVANSTTLLLQRASVEPTDIVLESVSVKSRIEVEPLIIPPVTQEMTLTEAWTVRGDAYTGLASTTAASIRVDATIRNTDSGILVESGASGDGLVVYVFSGVLYLQCGDGAAFGTDHDRAEIAYVLPIGEFDYIIETSANTSNAVLYVNGLAVNSQVFSHNVISGSDEGTFGEVESGVAVNRGGWTADGDGVYTNTITKCDIFNGQVTSDV
jgi:hypothetical protein